MGTKEADKVHKVPPPTLGPAAHSTPGRIPGPLPTPAHSSPVPTLQGPCCTHHLQEALPDYTKHLESTLPCQSSGFLWPVSGRRNRGRRAGYQPNNRPWTRLECSHFPNLHSKKQTCTNSQCSRNCAPQPESPGSKRSGAPLPPWEGDESCLSVPILHGSPNS